MPKRDVRVKMDSRGNAVSPRTAGQTMLLFDEMGREFRLKMGRNEEFIQRVCAPREGSFVVIFEIEASGDVLPLLQECPLIERYLRMVRGFFEWKMRLGGRPLEARGDSILLDGNEHPVGNTLIRLLSSDGPASMAAAEAFTAIEAEDSIGEVSIYSGLPDDPLVRIPKTAYADFTTTGSVVEDKERRVRRQMDLLVESPVLTGRDIQWRFVSEGKVLSAKMADAQFLGQVAKGNIEFVHDDMLEVDVEVVERFDARHQTWKVTETTVTKVRDRKHQSDLRPSGE